MAIIERKNKNKASYQVRVRDPNGEWYPSGCFGRREDALLEEARLLKLKRNGLAIITQDARVVTEGEYWEVWSVENRTDVSPGWRISQDQMHRDYVLPVLGGLKMKDIGPPEIGRCLNRVAELGRSDQMRKHVYSLLRKMFSDAVDYYEMLPSCPVRPKFHRPRVGRAKRAFLQPRAAWALLESVRDHYLGPAIWLQTLAALRPGEAIALRGRSLMFEQGQILISATWNKKIGVLQEHPKQEDWAYVPMAPLLRDYLKGLGRRPEAFVASGPDGRSMLSYNTYQAALKRICREVGVESVTPHELRHTCTELFIQAGASTEDVRRLLNHASLSATANYIHRTDERLSRIAANVVPLFPIGYPIQEQRAVSMETEDEGIAQ